jgi:hypothetical protein
MCRLIMEQQAGVALSPWFFSNMEFDAWDTTDTEHDMNTDTFANVTLLGSGDTMCTSSYSGYPDVAN